MSLEENKAIARRWNEEIFNNRNPDIIDELADASYVKHPGMGSSKDFKQGMVQGLAAFGESHIDIEDVIAEGDIVAFRWTARLVHTGEWMGVAPTGKEHTWTGISIYRIVGGKVVEDWARSDQLGWFKQMGIAPDMDQVRESSWD